MAKSASGNVNHRPVVELRCPIDLAASSDAGPRKFEIKAYTGKVIDSWFGGFVIDIRGMQTKKKVPILREHERDRIVGWSEETRREKDGLYLSGVFSDSTPDAKEVLALADEGFPWQASVGIKPLQVKILKNADESMEVNGRKFNGPLEIWTKTLVGETSMVSWGADNDTEMSLLTQNNNGNVPVEIYGGAEEGAVEMHETTPEELKEKQPALYEQIFKLGARSADPKIAELTARLDDMPAQLSAARASGVAEERTRCTELLEAEAESDATLKAIKEGTPSSEAFKAFFQAERENRAKKLEEVMGKMPDSAGAQGKPATASEADTATPDFMAEVKKFASDRNCTHAQAVRAVQRQHPELHAKWLESQRGGK